MVQTKNNAFTLVELIVVIVILAILATIAFLSFSSQSSGARDSTRLADMASISKGLSVFQTAAGKLPMPDSKIDITASGALISYQGYAGATVLNMVKLSNGGKDPIDNTYYTYSTNGTQEKFELLGFLENQSSLSYSIDPLGGFIVNADPSSYTGRYAITKGAQLGILLLSGTMVPAQTGNVSVDLVSSGNNYVIQIDSSSAIKGSSSNLKGGLMPKNGLIGYWDMDTLTASGLIRDLSGNGNDGTCMNGTGAFVCGTALSGPQFVNGVGAGGRAMNFDGADDAILMPEPPNSIININDGTISAWVKTTNAGVGYHGIFAKQKAYGMFLGGGFCTDNKLVVYDWADINPRCTTGNALNDNSYHMVTESFRNGVASGTTVYIDGLPVLKTTNTVLSQSEGLVFGNGANPVSGQLFSGSIDEGLLYNRPLTDGEVYMLYYSTK